MNFSDDDKHRATLTMLGEVLAYLDRLPPVPVTREFCGRLRAHLAHPTQRLIAEGSRELHGLSCTPAGLPLLEASVVDEVLTIGVPFCHTEGVRECALRALQTQLEAGPLSMRLAARNHYRG